MPEKLSTPGLQLVSLLSEKRGKVNSSRAPVLVIAYNRPAATREVLEAVLSAHEGPVYVAIDGPLRETSDGLRRWEEVQATVDALAVGPIQIRKLVREGNLGCDVGVSTAIDWFFTHEKAGFILEDDTVPHPAFFRFGSELISRYRDNEAVMAICGSSTNPSRRVLPASYGYSQHFLPWGWATWRRAWEKFDSQMSAWPQLRDSGWLRSVRDDPSFERYWRRAMEATYRGDLDTWDHKWRATIWLNQGLVAIPRVNLIRNVGFGADATHTRSVKDHRRRLTVSGIEDPLVHPPLVQANTNLDNHIERRWFRSRGPRARWREFRNWVSGRRC